MSTYIQLDTSYFTHRKTMRLEAAIGIDARWVMPRLWCFALQSQPDGDFGKWTNEELALAIGYCGPVAALYSALEASGYMDTSRKLVNWQERQAYARMATSRARKAALTRHSLEKEEIERKKESEQCSDSSAASTSRRSSDRGRCTQDECSAYCVELGLPTDDGAWFVDKAEGNGWKNGGHTIKDWKATIRAWKRAGYMASQRVGQGGGVGSGRSNSSVRAPGWSIVEYSKAQLAKLRDDLKFANPGVREELRASIAKHEAVIAGAHGGVA